METVAVFAVLLFSVWAIRYVVYPLIAWFVGSLFKCFLFKVKCPACRATGAVHHGSHQDDCSRCGGSGQVRCTAVNCLQGYYTDGYGQRLPCATCSGSGEVRCGAWGWGPASVCRKCNGKRFKYGFLLFHWW